MQVLAVPDHWPLTTGHRPWTVGPFRPSLERGDSPRNAPLAMLPCVRVPCCRVGARRVDATVPARFQPATDTTRTRRQRTCAAPAVRITNHESRITAVLDGRAVPALPCAGGLPPQRPPVAMLPCVRVPCCRVGARRVDATVSARFQPAADTTRTRRQRTCAAPAVRITNHESRITAVLDGRAVPALPCAGGLPPQRPSSYATVRACPLLPCRRQTCRRHSACSIPACRRHDADTTPAYVRGSRSSNHESRITNHGRSGRSGRSGPPLCGGTPPATPPVAMLPCVRVPCCRVGARRVDATVPARFQPAADTTRTRRQRTCAAPAVRITNHESRVTAVLDGRAVPALPCAGGLPPQRPSSYATVRACPRLTCQRPSC